MNLANTVYFIMFRDTELLKKNPEISTRPDFMLSLTDAVKELKRRQGDKTLRARVEEYLSHDIPGYLTKQPALVLMRYVASPNHEALRFIPLAKSVGLHPVISSDYKDFFSPHTTMKRSLCKMPVIHRVTETKTGRHESVEYVTISDCNPKEQVRFNQMTTKWGESFTEFHTKLFRRIVRGSYELGDDTAWIDRHKRGELLEHYKQYLALFIVHGVFCEDYFLDDMEEVDFIESVVRPAYDFVYQMFGVPPLMAELTPPSAESETYWYGYSPKVYDILQQKLSDQTSRGLSSKILSFVVTGFSRIQRFCKRARRAYL